MEYDIVESYSTTGLKLSVRRYIEQGWQPLGGMVTYDGFHFYQTIVRRDLNDETSRFSESG